MYAVIKTGGKQYRVQPGDTVEVELLEGEQGKTIDFAEVLLLADGDNITIGTPQVAGAKVTAEVIDPEKKGEKVVAFKFRRRKGYHRKIGIRPRHTVLKIKDIIPA
jgi:large subunit ribosomal protein L21